MNAGRILLCALVGLWALTQPLLLPAQDLGSEPTSVSVAFEEDHGLPLVRLNCLLPSGASSDPKKHQGLTYVTGKMLLRGTARYTKNAFEQAIEQLGAELDIDLRADALVLRGAVVATELTHFLELLEEAIVRPRFDPAEFKKYQKIHLSHLDQVLGHDEYQAQIRFERFLFGDHPYGNPIIGNRPGVRALTPALIQAHYKKLKASGPLQISGSGDASSSEIAAWAARINQQARFNVKTTSLTLPAPSPASSSRVLLIDKPDVSQSQIYLGQIGILITDDRYMPLHVANHAFGGASFSTILTQEVREKRGLSYGANSQFKFGLQPRSWSIHTFPKTEKTVETIELILGLIDQLSEQGLTPAQFDYAKGSLEEQAGFLTNTPQKRTENLILETILHLPSGFFKDFCNQIRPLTRSTVNNALRSFIRPSAMKIVVLGAASQFKKSLIKALELDSQDLRIIPYSVD